MKKIDSAKVIAQLGIIYLICMGIYLFVTNDESTEKLNHEIEILKDSCDFAIGYSIGVSQYNNGGLRGHLFDFKYMNKEYHSITQYPKETNIISPEYDYEKDKHYLVLVDKSNPEKSKICFDKPIIDSIDFKKYIKEFVSNRER